MGRKSIQKKASWLDEFDFKLLNTASKEVSDAEQLIKRAEDIAKMSLVINIGLIEQAYYFGGHSREEGFKRALEKARPGESELRTALQDVLQNLKEARMELDPGPIQNASLKKVKEWISLARKVIKEERNQECI